MDKSNLEMALEKHYGSKGRKVSKSVYVSEKLWKEVQREFPGAVSELIEAALLDALELKRIESEKRSGQNPSEDGGAEEQEGSNS